MIDSIFQAAHVCLMSKGAWLRVLSFTKESSFNPRPLPDLGGSKSDRWSVGGILFCMLILTVGSRLCTFCRLHLRTLRDHCCAAQPTPRSMTSVWTLRDSAH